MSRRDPLLSVNCHAQHGMPHRPHDARCTGCEGCPCHATTPPANFREIVERQRARAAEARAQTPDPERGEAPGSGTGGAR